MGFFVVSRRALLRDLIASYCTGEGIEVHGVAERLSDIRASSVNPIVLLHLTHGDEPEALEIEAFRERYEDARIVVLCSRRMFGKLQSLPPGLIEVMVLDDSSLRSLSGVLTLVMEGFVITPAVENARARSGAVPDQMGERPGDPQPHGRGSHRDSGPAHMSAHAPARVSTTHVATHVAAGAEPETMAGEEDEGVSSVAPTEGRRLLSRREAAVIRKLCEGASNKDIANALNIGESTVKVHLRACYRKIGVRNRTQAAIWAAKHLSGTARLN